MISPLRSPELLDIDRSRVLLIDVQERFIPVIEGAETVVQQCVRIIRGAQLLGVPVHATEQYPKGLGPTVPELNSLVGDCPEKMEFSSANSFEWSRQSGPEDRDQIVLVGIEAHVCMIQTALDLLSRGFRVFVPADATSSRLRSNCEVALARMTASGVTVTCVESVLFEWCQTAAHPQFKQISQLVK